MTTLPASTGWPEGASAAPSTVNAMKLDHRSRRVLVLLIGIWVLNVFDLQLTVQAANDGMLYEDNPLARSLLAWSPDALRVFKAGILAATSVIFFRYRREVAAEIAAYFVLVVYVYVAWRWKMCYDCYDLMTTRTISPGDAAILGIDISSMPIY